VAHIVTFVFYCVVLPSTVLVPEVSVPKWGAVYIPSIVILLDAIRTPGSVHLFYAQSNLSLLSSFIKLIFSKF
jgi:beta-mannan synthase